MSQFVVRQFEPTWVECFYVVDAENAEQAEEKVCEGDYEYIGHTCSDEIDGLDIEGVEVEPIENCPPFMLHAEKEEVERFWPKQAAES